MCRNQAPVLFLCPFLHTLGWKDNDPQNKDHEMKKDREHGIIKGKKDSGSVTFSIQNIWLKGWVFSIYPSVVHQQSFPSSHIFFIHIQ